MVMLRNPKILPDLSKLLWKRGLELNMTNLVIDDICSRLQIPETLQLANYETNYSY